MQQSRTARPEIGGSTGIGPSPSLKMTPSVALRCLHDEINHYLQSDLAGRPDLFHAFSGEIRPPRRHVHRPMGDGVVDAIAEYAAKVVTRAGMLTARHVSSEEAYLHNHGRLLREIFAIEHSVGVDLKRNDPNLDFRTCDAAARSILGVAAFWFDRDELLWEDDNDQHPLLGTRPTDPIGMVLYDHALASWYARNQPPSRPPRSGGTGKGPIGIELNLASAG